MSSAGRDEKYTTSKVLQLISSSSRPVWTGSSLAEELDISPPTARDRLQSLEDRGAISSLSVGNATAYYLPDKEDLPIEQRHSRDLVREYEDKFVGQLPDPSRLGPEDLGDSAEAGDMVQIAVQGQPGRWMRVWSQRVDDPTTRPREFDVPHSPSITYAVLYGELYTKPTVPIEHRDYEDDWDIEEAFGERELEQDTHCILACGLKNYLFRPCNDALFITDVEIDFIDPALESAPSADDLDPAIIESALPDESNSGGDDA